ncbi:glycoside hydrolase family 16 protein [Panaeolus papilionaceus]|nr:glycoside hydrolase family 16 protein [Panaeolus papilionaceus]
MRLSFALLGVLFSSLPLEGLAGKPNESQFRSRRVNHHRSLQVRNNTGKTWELVDYYRGESFLNDWEFFAQPDPTHGNVNYLNRQDAIKKKLAYVQPDGTTILKVDNFTQVPVGGNRDSIRINTKKKYNGGLFIADFWSMPHGCSVWPAYWSVGPNWPAGGEIDILEGVHKGPINQYTLHTSAGCTMEGFNDKEVVSSNLVHPVCESSGLDNRGCGFADQDLRSYGKELNLLAGGVFVHQWDKDGIRVWRFFRGNIPSDIQSKRPDPAKWGKPVAFFPSTTCDMASHFYEHQLVINTSICGDLGGPTYAGSGCPGTCAEAVANSKNFDWAKWQINYIAVYE